MSIFLKCSFRIRIFCSLFTLKLKNQIRVQKQQNNRFIKLDTLLLRKNITAVILRRTKPSDFHQVKESEYKKM